MAIGIAAWGLVAGVAVAKSGMGVPLSILMTLLVYAGLAQIAALPLIAADAPILVVWATTLCVSLRFMAFSFHYRPYFAHLPLRQRMKLSFVMGDTSFALFIRRFLSRCRAARTRTTSWAARWSPSVFGRWPPSRASCWAMASRRPGTRLRGHDGAAGADLHAAAQPGHRHRGGGRRLCRRGGLCAAAEAEHHRRHRGRGGGGRAGRPRARLRAGAGS